MIYVWKNCVQNVNYKKKNPPERFFCHIRFYKIVKVPDIYNIILYLIIFNFHDNTGSGN